MRRPNTREHREPPPSVFSGEKIDPKPEWDEFARKWWSAEEELLNNIAMLDIDDNKRMALTQSTVKQLCELRKIALEQAGISKEWYRRHTENW